MKWVNWRKIHKENVREEKVKSNHLQELRKRRRKHILDEVKEIVKSVFSEIDRHGSYEKSEQSIVYYNEYVTVVALRFVAYKYGLGFEMREHKSGYVVAGCSKTYDVVLTRKS